MIFEHQSKNKKVILAGSIFLVIFGILLLSKNLIKKEAPVVPIDSSWERIKNAIANCEAVSTFQSHSRDVVVELKDGTKISTIEPNLDDVMKLAVGAEGKCGRIRMATE